MSSPSAVRASDKQLACRKLTSLLQNEYGQAVPKVNLHVLETMLFAACLEDNGWEAAEQGYDRLLRSYYDLNEIRVSSVAEIEGTLADLRAADWKGLRIRAILRFVFESTYTFEYERLNRLTLDSARKRLNKINSISPFIRRFTLQQSLGGYELALDSISTRAAIALGIVPLGFNEDQAADFLKPGVKKANTFAFAWYLRCLATDPKYIDRFGAPPDESKKTDVTRVEEHFENIKKPPSRRKKSAAKKTPSAKSASKTGVARRKPDAARARSASKSPVAAGRSRNKSVTKRKTGRKATATTRAPAKRKMAAKSAAAAKKRAAAKKTIRTSAVRSPAKKKKSIKKRK